MDDSLTSNETAADVPIVAVGASAGGITALQKLFRGLPAPVPFAIVVLQHLPAGSPSALPALIAKCTHLPVRAATAGVRPEANRVYFPSPEHVLTLEDGVFATRPAQGGSRRPGIDTIDSFLESLALREQPPSIAVILSGTGMDGTAGAVRIRQAGGVVIVQDPLTALHDGMPNAVIRRGIHHHILPVGAIGQQLVACTDRDYAAPVSATQATDDVTASLHRIISLVRMHAGFDLSGYKPSPLLWRIQQRMDVRKVWRFDDYASLLEDDLIELEALVRKIPLHVTEFFRDADAWETLRHDVLEPLLFQTQGRRSIRVWTTACATGEEAYSVAMLLDDISRERKQSSDFKLFATDAAPELVALASRGVFRKESLGGLSKAQQSRYFYEVDGAFRVKRALREKLVFVPQDLIADPPLSGLDLVTCRNLLIYLAPETVKDVLNVLHGSLREGGFLFLGRSEALPLDGHGFESVSRKWNIYRKTGPMPTAPRISHARTVRHAAALPRAALRVAYERFDIPSVLTDQKGNVLRTYGRTSGILALPPGEPSLNVIHLVPQPWAACLRQGMLQAVHEERSLILTVSQDGASASTSMNIRVTPLRNAEDRPCDRLLVSFIRGQDDGRALAADGSSLLRDDLGAAESMDWKDEARISREEVDASHEELLALNEELKASNEQLARSIEDLDRSNTELQANIAELAMQHHVLLCAGVMTMFLDTALKLRWFTSSMRDVFPLRSGDTGRSIADLVPIFRDDDFYADIERVLHASKPLEAVIRDDRQRCFVRKIFPYSSDTGETVGVAVTFVDIASFRDPGASTPSN
ncbi:CheR family methyltransferase [Caballeronia sp. ATUFL_F1_KS4A]|uniref:CheR family methyltransferase n=1 Tax=Caballeronia sp. ATUFL_F1_KS4A TaxID=2921768 RepID=UPI0020277010|nr:CheR family methyltransferase [Caballeronia sp. ATUFL_F1_KS4A]